MAKKEQYGLVFYKKSIEGFGIQNLINIKAGYEKNYLLNYIDRWGQIETRLFLYDLNKCLEMKGNYEESFEVDSTEMLEVLYAYPNVTIRDESSNSNFTMVIPMVDMKALLEEWQAFIS